MCQSERARADRLTSRIGRREPLPEDLNVAIPDFQSVMYPLLQLLADGAEHRRQDDLEALSRLFTLSDDEREQLLASGRQRVFDNRVSWAKTYLVKAGLVARTGRSVVRITDRGRDVLDSGVQRIDVSYLARFPEFEEFRKRPVSESGAGAAAAGAAIDPSTEPVSDTRVGTTGPADRASVVEQTPAELLEFGYERLRQALADDVIGRVKDAPAAFFERLVVSVLVAMGYGGSRLDAGQAVGRSGDDGIDGIIKEDRLGLDSIYGQAKRWDQPVGRPVVQAFAAALRATARARAFSSRRRHSREKRASTSRASRSGSCSSMATSWPS
jgi:restriction system protein